MTRRISPWMTLFVAMLVLLIAIIYIEDQIEAQANRPAPVKEIIEQHPDVSVLALQPGSYEAKVTAYGAAAPHFKLSLTAQVAGRVVELAAAFEPGQRLKKGDLLARLETSDYQAAVASAEQDLSDARLSLLEEKRKALQAKAEWESSGVGGKPASELVLRQPQMEAAQAAISKAEAALASARKDLEQTSITAPFDALVVERDIAPGSYLQAGGAIATLYSTDRIEVTVSLSAAEWANLPESGQLNSGQWPVDLVNTQSGQHWSGHILRAGQHLDSTSRQRDLILAVDQPFDSNPPLLAGTFVRATIPGRQLEGMWRLPSSALSQKGYIWYVKADNTLASFASEPQFSDAEYIYMKPPEELGSGQQKVLRHPLSSYLTGMVVNPVEETSHE